MKNLPYFRLLPLALALGCNPAPTDTSAPGAAASRVAPSLATLDIRPAVELQLPKSAHGTSYLQLVSAQVLKAEPLSVQQPGSWTALRQGQPVVPGYRIAYEAVIKWQPLTDGPDQQKMPILTLYTPTGRDTLACFYTDASQYLPDTSRFTASRMLPDQPLTVRGTLYAYEGKDRQQQRALIVYPYNHKGGAFTNDMRHLALPFPR